MKTPDIPIDEEQRLKKLRSLNILDTPPEEHFDRLTRVTKKVFNVPMALVSLVDCDRQWFKSSVGLTACETTRDISFCGHAIFNNDVLVISDTLNDFRFADNPLVVGEPHIRFYAGCPIRVDGYALGTLCILDTQKRNFKEDDVATLKDLATIVEQNLSALQLSTIDELTNVLNRRGFLNLAQHSLNLCARQGISATLIFIDLDKFKNINDTFGHAEGNCALITFSNLIKKRFRTSDIFARLGGDEFVLLLPNTSKEIAKTLIAECHNTLTSYNACSGYEILFSCGIVEYTPEKLLPNIDDLLALGDAVMYNVKRSKQ